MVNQKIKDFIKRWTNRGREKQDTQKFWIELLKDVLGVEHPFDLIEFEKSVKLKHKSFIDAYIPSTRVLIEQKSQGEKLNDATKQSDGKKLTPYEQAKRYSDWLPFSQHARWIVTCNFQEFWIYDMETPKADPEVIQLKNLDKEWQDLKFLIEVNEGQQVEADVVDALFYEKVVDLHFVERRGFVCVYSVTGVRSRLPYKTSMHVRLDELFKHISLRLTGRHSLNGFINAVSSYQKGYDVDVQDALVVKNKYEQLGLIRDVFYGNTKLIELTALGRKVMNELNPV